MVIRKKDNFHNPVLYIDKRYFSDEIYVGGGKGFSIKRGPSCGRMDLR